MFSFLHVYPTSLYKEGLKPRNVRTRILGFVHPDQVLYLVMTSHQTEILLVDKDGKSQTVLVFNRYIEIICADISSDFDLLIYTERIPNGTKFSFRSVMYHIHSFSDIKAFEDNSPITSLFLPDINNNNNVQPNSIKKEYLFVNIIGNRVAFFRATFANKKLQIKQERIGLNLTNCRSYFYNSNRNNRLICAITRNNTAYFYSFGKNRYFYHVSYKLTSYETIKFNKIDLLNLTRGNNFSNNQNKSRGGFSIFGVSKDKSVKFDNKESFAIPNAVTPEMSVKLMNTYSTLPPELALLPSVPSNYPFFRFSSGNMHVIRLIPLSSSPNSNLSSEKEPIKSNSSSNTSSSFCKDFAIIEQLYRGEEHPLAFTVTIAEQNYSRLIEVPNVQPDVPINFLSYDCIVFVFVLNSFVSMIDFMVFPPSIYFLPRIFSQGPQLNSGNAQAAESQQTSSCCDISSTTGNFTVDLESGEVYHIGISLKENTDNLNLNFSDRKILKIFATFIARLPNYVSLSSIINKLPINEIGTLLYFFHAVFQIGLAMELIGKPKSRLSTSQKPVHQPPKLSPVAHAPKLPTRLSSTVNHDNINSSISSSSSASGGGISLISIDESSIAKNNFFLNQSQSQIQNFTYRNHNTGKHKAKHYGRTIHDLDDMRPPLPKDKLIELEDMSKEFPSLGKYTRVDSFLYLLYQFRTLNIRENEAPDIALRYLHLQNNLSFFIRAGLDEWVSLFNPNEATKFILFTVVISEAMKNSAPSISCLDFEVETMADSICSQTIRSHLRCSARLFGISRTSHIAVSQAKKQRSRNNSTNISMSGLSLVTSTNSLSPRSNSILRRKTLGGSAAVFSSNKPTRGKRNSLSSFPITIPSKIINIQKGNSSSNFFRKLKFNQTKNVKSRKNSTENIKPNDPQTLCNKLKMREDLELKYWSYKLPYEFKDIFGSSKNESESESSTLGTNSIVMSRLNESQWSRADTTFGSEGSDS